MNLNIYSSYQTPSFSAKISLKNGKNITEAVGKVAVAVGLGVVASKISQDRGMSAEELSGRTQVMQENAAKSNPVYQFCVITASELASIEKGEYDDNTKSDVENVSRRIDMIREKRAEIKDYASKYIDKDSKDVLRWNLETAVDELEEMKSIRNQLGGVNVDADATDEQENNEIFEMLEN